MLTYVDLKILSLVAGVGAEVEVSAEIDATASVNLPGLEAMEVEIMMSSILVSSCLTFFHFFFGALLDSCPSLHLWVLYKQTKYTSQWVLIQISLLMWENQR